MKINKFRAWAEKTVDNRWDFAYSQCELECKSLAELGEDYDEYEIRAKYSEEWNKTHATHEQYTKTLEMITDIKVNGNVQRPYGYEIIKIMQFVGLKDEDRKEIFEGDLIDYGDLDNGDKCIFQVKWERATCSFVANGRLVEREKGIYPFKIIGNIHENPKLIKNND